MGDEWAGFGKGFEGNSKAFRLIFYEFGASGGDILGPKPMKLSVHVARAATDVRFRDPTALCSLGG